MSCVSFQQIYYSCKESCAFSQNKRHMPVLLVVYFPQNKCNFPVWWVVYFHKTHVISLCGELCIFPNQMLNCMVSCVLYPNVVAFLNYVLCTPPPIPPHTHSHPPSRPQLFQKRTPQSRDPLVFSPDHKRLPCLNTNSCIKHFLPF